VIYSTDCQWTSVQPLIALSLTEVMTLTELNKNAVFRLLFTMVEKGFLKKVPDSGKYMLSPKCLELGRVARIANSLRKVSTR
jgi:DNA-binding IclR family transcriptional regulator